MRKWLFAGVLALAFAGVGVFFLTRDSLSDMDQYASVGSFFLALVTLAVTAVAAARSRAEDPAAATPGSQFGNVHLRDVGQVNMGNGNINFYRAGDAD